MSICQFNIHFCYNTIRYLFSKNIQGDIIGLHNDDGTLVATYVYDAWGNHKVYGSNGQENTEASFIANINPFRYRGYYYDVETKLYYLNSRYYDPEVGRFISPDILSILDETMMDANGLNLYMYCGNNPVMFTDPFGTTKWWEWLIAGVIVAGLIVGSIFTGGLLGAAFVGAAIGAGISLGSQAIFTGELNWGQFALDIGVGAITGMIGASNISRLGATIVGALIGGVSNLGSQMINGASLSEINWWKVAISAGLGGVAGLMGGAGARNSQALNSATKVSKAINSVNKVLARIQSGTYYSSARYAQAAFTNVAVRLGIAVANQQLFMFTMAMFLYGVGTGIYNVIDSLWS